MPSSIQSSSLKPLAIIMRGLPGSGKSHWATRLTQRVLRNMPHPLHGLCSTDHYFYRNGAYHFDPRLLSKYHERNLQRFCALAAQHWPLLVCDNTNMQLWEFQPYLKVALGKGYRCYVVEVGMPFSQAALIQCASRNRHGVSLSHISRMAARYESAQSLLSTENIALHSVASCASSIT